MHLNTFLLHLKSTMILCIRVDMNNITGNYRKTPLSIMLNGLHENGKMETTNFGRVQVAKGYKSVTEINRGTNWDCYPRWEK